MLHRPRFKPHYHPEIVPGDGLVLISEFEQTLLPGRHYEVVGALIDGQRTVDDIIEKLRGRGSADDVRKILAKLEEKGYLVESDDSSLPAHEAAWWSTKEIPAGTAQQRLTDATVAVGAVGPIDADAFRAVLETMHLRLGEPGQLQVVLTDDYLRSDLAAINREALSAGRPWLLVKPVGGEIWVGPLFRPGATGCWECLAQRLRLNRRIETFLQERKGWPEPIPRSRGSNPAALQIGYNLTALAVADWLAGGQKSDLEGRIWTLDLQFQQARWHTLSRRPQCPACGTSRRSPEATIAPIELQSRPKTFTEDGGHRTLHPLETIRRFEHHISRITGVIPELGRLGGATNQIMHVYGAGTNLGRASVNVKSLRRDLRSNSSGKGMTDVQARASAIAESLERYSGVFQGDEPRHTASLRDLGETGIHPNACMLFSDRQYAQGMPRDNPTHYNLVPIPFDPDAVMEWSPLWSLTHRTVRYLPTSYCYYNYPNPDPRLFCPANSNGNAAGNNLEEAVLQGFLELVERDGIALWWQNRVQRPGVDLNSFDEPYLGQLRKFLHAHGRELWALDLTSDLQIPTFVAMSRRTADPEERIVLGFGSHLDARIALIRAVTEMNQMLAQLWEDTGETAGINRNFWEHHTGAWLQTATLAEQPYLAPDSRLPSRAAPSYPRIGTADVRDDVLACQALVEQRGLEMLVQDQTRPDIGLSVVKVVVPGLRHFWPRFAPGRLYDIPVQLSWLSQPVPEDQLNPIPAFF